MTSLAQVTALVDAHVNRDHARFRAVTLQIAAHIAARSEQGAEHLRKLIEQPQAMAFTPLPSAGGLLSAPPHVASLDEMVISPGIRGLLDRVVLEYAQRGALSFVHGLESTRKLLFTGPAGVGKTMAAGALSRALELPMFRVELHAVIASHLGETAANLAKVFDHIRTMPAVYLFDEFDALGADRGTADSSSASAEMRRVVNSLLQFIEDDRSDSVIVAATNHDQMLDSAIFRRFDEMIAFTVPSRDELIELVRRTLVEVDIATLDFDTIWPAVANPKLGHADVCAALTRVLKDHILGGTTIDTAHIAAALTRRIRAVRREVAA